MDKLSLDILLLIVAELDFIQEEECRRSLIGWDNRQRLAQYATISRQWQYAIETRTFRDLHLRIKPHGDFETFAKTLASRRRRQSVARISCRMVYPKTGVSKEEDRENKDFLSFGISLLFRVLKEWDMDAPVGALGSIQLVFAFSLSTDVEDLTGLRPWVIYYPSLGDEDIKQLPAVNCITSFLIVQYRLPALHPLTACRIAKLMPRLDSFEIDFWDPRYPKQRIAEIRTKLRLELAKGIIELKDALPLLKKLKLQRNSEHMQPGNSCYQPEILYEGNSDPLAPAIRLLAKKNGLEELRLDNVFVSKCFFQELFSGDCQEPPQTSPWSQLRRFEISDVPISLDGKWYFTGDPGDLDDSNYDVKSDGESLDEEDEPRLHNFVNDLHDDEHDTYFHQSNNHEIWPDENGLAASGGSSRVQNGRRYPERYCFPQRLWRTQPDSETFDPLLLALANGVLKMPKLKNGKFKMSAYSFDSTLLIEWAANGLPLDRSIQLHAGENGSPRCIVQRSRGSDWEPSEEIISALGGWAEKGNVIIS